VHSLRVVDEDVQRAVQRRRTTPTDARLGEIQGRDKDVRVPGGGRDLEATRFPASALRTARVTSAPAPASARAVSMPMPELAPVTMARPVGEIDTVTTSPAVDSA